MRRDFILILLSSYLTKLGDASSKRVMISAALVTSGIDVATFFVDRPAPEISRTVWFFCTHVLGALAPLIGNAGVIGLPALMGVAGALLGTALPDVEQL